MLAGGQAVDIVSRDVVGFYTLTATSIALDALAPELIKKLPRYPLVPAALLGRIAIAASSQGKGLGAALLADAFLRVARVEMGVYAMLVDAKDEAAQRAPVTPTHQVMFEHMLNEGASFWSEVYEPFMARDLTRHEVRELVRLGLEHTRGNYKLLVSSFNMPPEDYKKFLNFLRKYQCHVPFQRFRMMTAAMSGRSVDSAIA